MNIALFRVILAGILVACSAHSLFAQRVTVQQPVVQVFSVDTVVSVPDRGSAYLGGVSTAAEGRGTYGLFPLGSGTGFSRSHTGMGVSAYIHDFESMDTNMLSQPRGRPDSTWVNPNLRAAAAFDALSRNRNSLYTGSLREPESQGLRPVAVPSTPSRSTGPPQTDDPAELAEYYLARAREAEQLGKGRVAMLCYRMAARYGSTPALQELSRTGGE